MLALGNESWVVCPYALHTILESKFFNHVNKCPAQPPRGDNPFVECPADGRHYVLRIHLAGHLETCCAQKESDIRAVKTPSPWSTPEGLATELVRATQPVFRRNEVNTDQPHTRCRGCNDPIRFTERECKRCYLLNPQQLTVESTQCVHHGYNPQKHSKARFIGYTPPTSVSSAVKTEPEPTAISHISNNDNKNNITTTTHNTTTTTTTTTTTNTNNNASPNNVVDREKGGGPAEPYARADRRSYRDHPY
eukprot:TRINITY_DN3653_c0_g1_i1.p1 TRINITY_DN3653_c0_g1~~TRINITY_DN3653_c0_g1_i1.p1  ORF type:complete len:257 (-),score=52.20 TRINITY_DN3653_c0_g1_i1:96-845(-)